VSTELPNEALLFVAGIEARYAKANSGPIDVHRYDNDGGSIAYQLQQSGRGEDSVVLCAFDDDDNPKARDDAEFAAKAWTDAPALCALVRSRQELLEAVLQNSISKDARLSKLESAARFAYDAILSSSVCDEPCECIDCRILETLGEALDIPRIGET